MELSRYEFTFRVYDEAGQLDRDDSKLLDEARLALRYAYAPYSRFQVGAAAFTENGDILTGANQENASFPVGICAERALLVNAAVLHPGKALTAIAITYFNELKESNYPITPCGMCRQALLEYEQRFSKPIRLILGGRKGKIFVLDSCSLLLPLAFEAKDLK
ncbi:MAG: cytidine deaminase [Chitinophagaceae bacterium]|nr:cytidine deaminase [Chitinophagaceae bacterium]